MHAPVIFDPRVTTLAVLPLTRVVTIVSGRTDRHLVFITTVYIVMGAVGVRTSSTRSVTIGVIVSRVSALTGAGCHAALSKFCRLPGQIAVALQHTYTRLTVIILVILCRIMVVFCRSSNYSKIRAIVVHIPIFFLDKLEWCAVHVQSPRRNVQWTCGCACMLLLLP
jgi:hypothetical protein